MTDDQQHADDEAERASEITTVPAEEVLMTGKDVLLHAQRIVETGTLRSDHGDWCPWCAIGQAKGELDVRLGYHVVPFDELVRQVARNSVIEYDCDQPLVEARTYRLVFKNVGAVRRVLTST